MDRLLMDGFKKPVILLVNPVIPAQAGIHRRRCYSKWGERSGRG